MSERVHFSLKLQDGVDANALRRSLQDFAPGMYICVYRSRHPVVIHVFGNATKEVFEDFFDAELRLESGQWNLTEGPVVPEIFRSSIKSVSIRATPIVHL